MHLIIVGNQDDNSNEPIAGAIAAQPLTGVVMARCPSPDQLVDIVADVRRTNRNERVDVLDIVDHGRPGAQLIGASVLFGSDDNPRNPLVGRQHARLLDEHLAETAQVRLLGCNTGGAIGRHGMVGRQLLFKLSKELQRHRVAFGTLRPTSKLDFTTGRFLIRLEDEILLSAHSVIDGEPPIDSDRLANLGAFRP